MMTNWGGFDPIQKVWCSSISALLPSIFDFDDLGQQPCCDAVRFAQKGATSRKLSIGYLRDLSARCSDVAAVLRRAVVESCRIEPSQMLMTTDASATSYMMLGVLPGASRSIWWIISIAVVNSIFATMRKLTSSVLRDPWLAGAAERLCLLKVNEASS